MFTVIIRNSRNGRDITLRTLNRKKIEVVRDSLYPPKAKLTETEVKAKAQFQEMLDSGEDDLTNPQLV